MNYEVRCCCDAGRLLGHIEIDTSRSREGYIEFPLLPDYTQRVQLPLAVLDDGEGGRYLALKSNDHPIELLRRIPQFVEYNKTIYACNNRWCGWTGPLRETCMLGAIGPLCPRCRETTTER